MKTLKKRFKRSFAMFLTLAMCLSMLDLTVFAGDGDAKQLICGKEEHTHKGTLCGVATNRTCGMEEHKHSDECYEVVVDNNENQSGGDGTEVNPTPEVTPEPEPTPEPTPEEPEPTPEEPEKKPGTGTGTGTGTTKPEESKKPETEEPKKPETEETKEPTITISQDGNTYTAVWTSPEGTVLKVTNTVKFNGKGTKAHPGFFVWKTHVENKTYGTVWVSNERGGSNNNVGIQNPAPWDVERIQSIGNESIGEILTNNSTVTVKLSGKPEKYTFQVPFAEVEIVEKHRYGDWVIDEEATLTKEGKRHRDCVLGDDTQEDVIPVPSVVMTPIGATYGGSNEVVPGEVIDGVYTVKAGAKAIYWEVKFSFHNNRGNVLLCAEELLDGAIFAGVAGTGGQIKPLGKYACISDDPYVANSIYTLNGENSVTNTIKYEDRNNILLGTAQVSSTVAIAPEEVRYIYNGETDDIFTYNGEEQGLPLEDVVVTKAKEDGSELETVPTESLTITGYENENGNPIDGEPKDAGKYTAVIKVDGADEPIKVEFEIRPATLTASYVSERIFAGNDPSGRIDVVGFVGGESAETAEDYVAPTVSFDGTDVAGVYTVTPDNGVAKNYIFEYVPGILTVVNPAVEPENPAQPEEPAQPENPTVPENPAVSDDPTVPETPVQPENPTAPQTPIQPTNPLVPAETPTVVPTAVPTLLPGAPTTPAAVPVLIPEATPEPEVESEDEDVPLTNTTLTQSSDDTDEMVEAADEEVPLASSGVWALLNLILAIGTALVSVILLIGYFGKKKEEDEEESKEYRIKRKGTVRLISLIPAFAGIITFLLTENMNNAMVIVDQWTWMMVVIALVQIAVCVFARKEKEDPDNDKHENVYA